MRGLDGTVHPAYDAFLHSADLAVLRIAGSRAPAAAFPLAEAMPTDRRSHCANETDGGRCLAW